MTHKVADERYMAAAIRLANWNVGLTAQNPSVGAIIVSKDNEKIVGHGVTAPSGRPHAELQALEMAGSQAQDGTAYVTLEPCAHYGKTPPCAYALVNAGIKRVVIAFLDPDKRVNGQGVAILENAGISITKHIQTHQAFETLSAYLIRKIYHRPEVTLKMAVSADGGIGLIGKGHVKISNHMSHAYNHLLRARNDAIMIGVKTIIADNPELTCRLPGLSNRSPARIIVDPHLRIPLGSHIIKTAHEIPTYVFSYEESSSSKVANILKKKDVKLFFFPKKDNKIMPEDMLSILSSLDISSLLIEGGTYTAYSFLNDHLVDKINLFQSNLNLGGKLIKAPDFDNILIDFKKINEARFDEDCYSEWRCDTKCLRELSRI
ncbi:bifunctional diaminohydroxyphosphoribosylaminopyrimidine deaminase/5-amino-6-(5-phosphoribosylamino)uracil reductase RibD [Bartonella tamiae]|uniref:Riboflavin biosynthesis protein RibD n=1 Tax=Bartonella tamiae Th239 TaxID=1094558 RepID=J0ZKH0_9HYPH|nr:bifunctional diaminohydroxyphosphoribosylaminopyrimidine deaminase/5-amino-6-(5-phosphoribosylamino)uracil reductase RibD [Bartonella tamiae]EJF88853.1 riboflavin biosynthesis protein RibD [Bartonella tamiae Th239]EJF94897.1 riboflavin biosynthesis protein RibD [Bartonella tamiae Th307]